jgi:fibronectin-binding autotransporter adhesin
MAAKLRGATAAYNPKSRRMIIAAALTGLVGVMARSASCGAASLASDNASNSPYSGGAWTGSSGASVGNNEGNGQNGGSGFAPWYLGTGLGANSTGSGVDQSATWGFDTASAADLFGTTASPNINTGGVPFNPASGVSWAMWSDNVEPVDPVNQTGYRTFSSSLAVGDSFSVNIATGNMGTQGAEGFRLENLNASSGYSTSLFEFGAFGNSTDYFFDSGGYTTSGSGFSNSVLTSIKSVHDGSSTQNNGNGLTVTFTLTSSTTFILTVTPLGANQGAAETFNNEPLTKQSSNGLVPLNQLMLYNDNLGISQQYFYANSIQINSPTTLFWTGTETTSPGSGNGQTWDVLNNFNWYSQGGAAIEQFYQNANVTFGDTWNGNSVGNYNVTLSTAVTPGLVTVNNSAGNYIISGTGSISGAASLLKEGSDSLTLSVANSYTGGTQIGNGTLIVGNSSAIPTDSSVTFGDGSGDSGTLDLAGIGVTVGGLSVVAGSTGTQTITNNGGSTSSAATLTFAGGTTSSTFSGVIKNGTHTTALSVNSGTLVLSGANTYSGGTTISGGTLVGAAANVFSSGDLTINSGAVQLDGNNQSVANLQGIGGSINDAGSANAAKLTFGSDNTSQTYSGSISNGGLSFGPLSLADNSVGTQILNGALSYTGTTAIADGTLQISGAQTESLNGGISGGGNLIVGDGTTATNLTLKGTLSYTGNTTIDNASTLALGASAKIASPLINVETGGTLNVSAVSGGFTLGATAAQTLEGTGNVTGNVTVGANGTLSPGDAIGTLSVSGTVTFNSGSAFDAQVTPTSGTNDQLIAGGNVTLGGTETLSSTGTLTNGESFTVIQGNVYGSFAGVTVPTLNAGLSWNTPLNINNSIAGASNTYQQNYTYSVTNGTPVYSSVLPASDTYAGLNIEDQASGSRNTTVTFLGGTVSTATTVSVSFANRTGSNPDMISDVATVNGTGTDTYVLELNYIAADVTNGTLSPVLAVEHNNVFESAVLLNTGGSAQEITGAYTGADDVLGDYGVDTVNDQVWAVLNYSAGDQFGIYQRIPGDLAGTGSVTPSDLGLVQTNLFGSTGGLWSNGDFQGNGSPSDTVTPGDLGLAQSNLFATEPFGSSAGTGGGLITSSPVPEPGSLALMGAGTSILALIRRRSKKHNSSTVGKRI